MFYLKKKQQKNKGQKCFFLAELLDCLCLTDSSLQQTVAVEHSSVLIVNLKSNY